MARLTGGWRATLILGLGLTAYGGDALGLTLGLLGRQGSLDDLGDGGGVGVVEFDELGDEGCGGAGDVDGLCDGDEMLHDGSGLGDEQTWRGGDGGDATVDIESDVVGKHGSGVFREKIGGRS